MKVLLKSNNKDVEILESSSTLNENDDFIQKLRVNVEIPLSALEELFVVFESDNKSDATHKLPFIKVGEGYTVDIPDNVIKTGGVWNIQLFRRRYSSTNVYYTETASNVFFMSIGEGVKNGSGEKVTFAQIQTMYHAIESFLEDNGQDTGNLNERVAAIVKEQTKGLQPKEDESLKTNSKKVAEAINEVKGSIPFVPSWAQEQKKPTYSYTEITDKPFLLQVGETTGTAYDGAKGKKNAADIEALKGDKQDVLDFDGTYNASTNKVATVKTVTDKIASILANAPEAFDTLEEIASWINNHPQDVAALNAAIQTNKTGIATNAQAIINALSEAKKYADEKAVGSVVATVEGQNLVLTLKDENGTIIATTTVLLPIPESGSAGEKGDKGDKGERGTGILKVTTAPASYTTATAGKNPIKRMSLSSIKKEASVDEVLVGDCVSYSYYLYHIYYVDATYAYMDTYQSIRGATGSAGSKGDKGDPGEPGYTPVKGVDYFTEADKQEIVQEVIESTADTSNIPNYVITEAEEVADKVLSVRNAYSFVFGAISDIHSTGSDVSTLHAGQGLIEIDKLTTLDACLNFGDGIDSYFENVNADSFLHIRKCLHSVQREIPYIQMQGNHDQLKTDTTEDAQQKYFAYIGANNVGTVTDWDNRFRNYGYRDFPDQRMRVIYLNSVDVSEGENTGDCWLTAMQLSWLVNTALDFTDKDGWSFIIGCHHPLNWWYMDNLLTILNAYKGKASGSVTVDGTTVNYNFANATAEFIAHFHGHIHNFRVEKLGTNGVLSITIPNACFGRNNEYGTSSSYSDEVHQNYGDVDENGEQRQFNKTTGTAEDTAFNIVVIDRDNEKIHCFNYGAGIDRVVSFAGVVEPEEPNVPEVFINWIDTVGATDNTRLSTSDGSTKTQTGYVTSGLIDLSDKSSPIVIRTKGVDFSQSYSAIVTYDESGTATFKALISNLVSEGYATLDTNGNLTVNFSARVDASTVMTKRFKICGYGTVANFVLSVNQEIPNEPIVPDEPVEIVNILDTIGYTDGKRCKTSGVTLGDLAGATTFGWYDCSNLTETDVIRIYLPNGIPTESNNAYAAHLTSPDEATEKALNYYYQGYLNVFTNMFTSVSYADNIITLSGRITSSLKTKFRLSAMANGADCIMTLNQEISY